jgi:hypothetical protein
MTSIVDNQQSLFHSSIYTNGAEKRITGKWRSNFELLHSFIVEGEEESPFTQHK